MDRGGILCLHDSFCYRFAFHPRAGVAADDHQVLRAG